LLPWGYIFESINSCDSIWTYVGPRLTSVVYWSHDFCMFDASVSEAVCGGCHVRGLWSSGATSASGSGDIPGYASGPPLCFITMLAAQNQILSTAHFHTQHTNSYTCHKWPLKNWIVHKVMKTTSVWRMLVLNAELPRLSCSLKNSGIWAWSENHVFLCVLRLSIIVNCDYHGRDLASHITQGHAISRLVSMFQFIEELVNDNDCRCAQEIEGLSDAEDDIE
jgi:hypothetical protein